MDKEKEDKLAELETLFDVTWAADMRAIKRWQAATGRVLTWPDSADLTVWLLEQLDEVTECRDNLQAAWDKEDES